MGTKKLAHDAIIDELQDYVVSLELAHPQSIEERKCLSIISVLGKIVDNMIILEEYKEDIVEKLRDIQSCTSAKKYTINQFLGRIIKEISST